jgi:hypothetical protein
MTEHKTVEAATDFPLFAEEEGGEVSTSILEAPDAVASEGPKESRSLSLPKFSSSTSSPFRLHKKSERWVRNKISRLTTENKVK